jgi:HEPN domain-containing protein
MQPERYLPEDPQEWLNRARSSLLHAHADQPGDYLEDLCFDAQQSVEKALKALLIQRQVSFPYIHDLIRLMELLQENGLVLPEKVLEAAKLSDYAVEARYPGVSEPVSQEEYAEALRLAEDVMRWVEDLMRVDK